MKSLMCAPLDYYREVHNVYLRNSEHHQAIKKVISHGVPSAITRMAAGKVPHNNDFKVLSVGSGNGSMDQEVLAAVLNTLPNNANVYNTAVEPNEEEIAEYRSTVADARGRPDDAEPLHRVKFDWSCATFSDFTSRVDSSSKNSFDLVHFIYSLYYVNLEQALVHCYENELRDKGSIVCVLKSASDFLSKMTVRFDKEKLVQSEGAASFYDDHVIEVAKRHGWVYERHMEPASLDFTEIFTPESREGDKLLDFVTHYVDFRKTADPALLHDVMEFMKDNSQVGNDGKRKTEKGVVMVTIFKGVQ